ncbi:MAG: metallophosphoesterase family protein [Clostridia bacterium]|nr:metallophosphoesterase family protein [Clostridia bacterium]
MLIRALILSDIHGDDTTLRWLLEQVWKETGPIDAYVCLGDGVRDFDRVEGFIRQRDEHALMYAVCGNNDWGTDAPNFRIIELGGVKIYMTHGHFQRVKSSLYRLRDVVREAGCSLGLYGHTHAADLDYAGPTLANPGAACAERCALMEIENGKARIRLLNYSLT